MKIKIERELVKRYNAINGKIGYLRNSNIEVDRKSEELKLYLENRLKEYDYDFEDVVNYNFEDEIIEEYRYFCTDNADEEYDYNY